MIDVTANGDFRLVITTCLWVLIWRIPDRLWCWINVGDNEQNLYWASACREIAIRSKTFGVILNICLLYDILCRLQQLVECCRSFTCSIIELYPMQLENWMCSSMGGAIRQFGSTVIGCGVFCFIGMPKTALVDWYLSSYDVNIIGWFSAFVWPPKKTMLFQNPNRDEQENWH